MSEKTTSILLSIWLVTVWLMLFCVLCNSLACVDLLRKVAQAQQVELQIRQEILKRVQSK